VSGAVAASHGYLKFELPFASKKAPVVVAQKPIEKLAPAAPAAPPTPWVTSEEIAAQQKLGHIFLKFSLDKIIAMEAAGNNIQLYLSNWVKIDYPIATNPAPYSDKKKEYDGVEMTAIPYASIYPLVRSAIFALFDSKKWAGKLLAFGQ
jgi:hypothetical protein